MGNKKSDYYSYSHQESSIVTVGDFINDNSSTGVGLNIKDLLLYEDENGTKNIQYVINAYDQNELLDFQDIIEGFNLQQSSLNQEVNITVSTLSFPEPTEEQMLRLPLKFGTILNLELIKIDREGLIAESFQVINFTTFNSFLAKSLYDLLRDKNYERAYKSTNKAITNVREIFPHISVWIWSRAMSVDLSGQFSDTIINVTPFISSLDTSVTSNGGNFSFTLAPIAADYIEGKWDFSSGGVKGNIDNIVNESFFHTINKQGELKKNIFFHEKVLQQNDVVFIRFEELILETKRKSIEDLISISTSDLPGNIFDMIGLIDSVPQVTQSASVDVTISVQGRDLTKLLIEDGVYFYPLQFTDGGIFSNIDSNNTRVKRYDGQIKSRFQVLNKTIRKSLNFLKNALSTIRITSDTLFDHYGSERVFSNEVSSESQQEVEAKKKEEGIQEKSIKSLIERSIIIEKISDSPKEDDVENIYVDIISFIEFLFDNKLLKEDSQHNLLGWEEMSYEEENLKKNQVTKTLNDRLYKNKRNWLNQDSKPLSNEDHILLTKRLEDQANKIKLRISGSKGGVGLNTFLDREKSISTNNTSTFSTINFDLLLAESNSRFAIAETTDPQISSISQIQKKNLEDLLSEYRKIQKEGAAIILNIVPKFYVDLNEFAKEAFKASYRLIKSKRDVVKETFIKKPLPGIWSIINLAIDESVADRRIVDQSIGNEHGSLLNGIRKICQDPFVEFFTDTYGDKFHFIARKKPFDKNSLVSAINGQSVFEKQEPKTLIDKKFDLTKEAVPNNKVNLIIDIEEIDVISDSLVFSQESYSWYRLQLQNVIGGNDNSMAFAYLKAIYFKEYADMFGSKPLDITTNYIPYNPVVDKNKKLPTAYFIKQGTYDLQYMIETHVHLPFTRQGTITINGDRRIKKGTFIRYKGTEEIYYVDAVANNFTIDMGNIDRVTTLQVSRGMVEKHINPNPSIDGQTYSYFNITSLPIDPNVFTQSEKGFSSFNETVTSKWKINVDVFNFFIKRLQFLDEVKYKGEFSNKIPKLNDNLLPNNKNNNGGNNETNRA